MAGMTIGFNEKPCCKLFGDEKYQPPTVEELKTLLEMNNWTQRDVSILVGVSLSTVKKWSLSENSSGHRNIPYSAWRLLLIYAGKIYSKEDLDSVLTAPKKKDNE
ncbi:helix-turn-helix domain-containing protein [Marisediminitalea sp.]|uniref:helix-turn-helix domain-containing protein n=1 Tax=Marisediminitalea sp. TaxID=2662268 RepID=UPI003515553F